MNTALANHKAAVLASIIREHVRTPIRRLLIVGCGSGTEAAVLAAELRAEVVGVDLEDAFDPEVAAVADLRQGDATRLESADGSFDFVYCSHVLEHIPKYARALTEMCRVVSRGGAYCIGTPNRQPLAGYLGSDDATWREKIAWNLANWRARLRGQFRNECGAHAGLSRAELGAALEKAFGRAEDMTERYYLSAYRTRAALVRPLGRTGLGRFLFSSVYFLGAGASG